MFKLDPLLKKRINAFTIDLFIIVAINYFLMASFTNFLKVAFFHFPLKMQFVLINKFKYFNSLSMMSILFAYFSIFYFTTNGQSMGKMLMGLRVRSNSDELTLKESMIRAFSYVTCVWMASIPFLISFFRKDQLGLACLLSKTSVAINNEKSEAVSESLDENQLSFYIVEDDIEEQDKAA